MKKRVLAGIVTVLMVLSVISFPLQGYAVTYTREKLNVNYENCTVMEDYASSFEGNNVSFLSSDSLVKIAEGPMFSKGNKALQVSVCDMRWWQLKVKDETMTVEFTLGIDEFFNNELTLMLGSEQPAGINGDRQYGKLVRVGDKAVLLDGKNALITKLDLGQRYAMKFIFTRGENKYDVIVNGRTVKEEAKLGISVYSVETLFFTVTAGERIDGELPYLFLDDVKLYSKGRNTPQKYSTQERGEMPTVSVPLITDSDEIKVYLNDTRLKMTKAPVVNDGEIYIDAESLAEALGMSFTKGTAGGFTVGNDAVTASATVGSTAADINGNAVALCAAPEEIEGRIAVPADFINEAFNAKVWWDKNAGIFAITVGEYKNNGLLISLGGKLFMNGEPYYEISFNKFDLFYQIVEEHADHLVNEYVSEDLMYTAAEAAVKQLSEAGFKTIRVFMHSAAFPDLMYNEESQASYFAAMDRVYDLCDKYGLKIVVCLGLIEPQLVEREFIDKKGWVTTDEDVFDIVADPDSGSRQNVYDYLEMYINRYKDRDSVLLWEIKNEGNLEADIGQAAGALRYSLLELAEFYGACADKIRSIDDKHLVTSGDSTLRSCQWNLLRDIMTGNELTWRTDSVEEHFLALAMLNEKLDLVSGHVYGLGCGNTADFTYVDEYGVPVEADWGLFMEQAARLEKAFYNGETNTQLDENDANFEDETRKYLDDIIAAGVQLTHWWTFRADGIIYDGMYTWDCDDGILWELITEANDKIKETYVINAVATADEKTYAWEDYGYEVIDVTKIKEAESGTESLGGGEASPTPEVLPTDGNESDDNGKSCASFASGGFALSAALCAGAVMTLLKKNNGK